METAARCAASEPVNLQSAPVVRASNDASMFLNQLAPPKAEVSGAAMADPASAAAGGILAKFLPTFCALAGKLVPAGIGAGIMIAVDPPQNKRELFLRILVAFTLGYMFTGVAIDFLHQFGWFSFLDRTKPEHRIPVEFLLGACGWSFLGAGAMALKRFKDDPASAVHVAGEVKRELM